MSTRCAGATPDGPDHEWDKDEALSTEQLSRYRCLRCGVWGELTDRSPRIIAMEGRQHVCYGPPGPRSALPLPPAQPLPLVHVQTPETLVGMLATLSEALARLTAQAKSLGEELDAVNTEIANVLYDARERRRP